MNRKMYQELIKHCTEIKQLSKETHFMCLLKNGGAVTVSVSKGDEKNVWNNIKRNFRRLGVELPFKI